MMRRRGLRSFCHGVASTSTLLQLHGKGLEPGSGAGVDAASSSFLTVPPSVVGSCVAESEASGAAGGPAVTLEQMILQLDLDEDAARKARRAAATGEDEVWCPRRMSCVDGGSAAADHVLRSARDALNQYPRFSLDGRDAMYRASFSGYYDGVGRLGAAAPRDDHAGAAVLACGCHGHRPRASACCAAGAGCGALACAAGGYEMDLERTLRMPATVAGESVVWCKPGVVAKLMGLEAVPVPFRGGPRRRKESGMPAAACGGGVRKQRLRRTGQEELALQKERLFMALHGYDVLGSAARQAGGALRSGVGPDVSWIGRDGDGWEFRPRR